MPLNEELVAALTPDSLPPVQYELPPETWREGPEIRRWQWSQFMLRGSFADQVLAAALTIDGAWYAGLGLVPWTGTELRLDVPTNLSAAVHESGYVWGGIVLTSVPQPPHFLGDSLLWLGGPQFPIVVRHARYWPEALEVHDTGGLLGTAASWVKAAKVPPHRAEMEGCVTAAHVVGAGHGSYDIKDSGSLQGSAKVEEFGPPCLDTALMRLSPPKTLTPYQPQPPSSIAFGDPAAFAGAVTPAATGHVTHVSAHAKHTGSGVPMILCHDGLGAKGDSGALVEVNGAPTAMHLGKIELDGGAGKESRGVFLHQVGHVMKLEFFR